MSFILDALRKAETLRQAPAPAPSPDAALGDIAQPAGSGSRKPLLAAAVATGVIAIAATGWWLGRQSTPASVAVTPAAPTAAPTGVPASDTRREIRPLDREVRSARLQPPSQVLNRPAHSVQPGTVEIATEALTAEPASTASRGANPYPGAARSQAIPSAQSSRDPLPNYDELTINGRVQLPPLHLDIHVFAAEAERRFVFVNNRKYREGENIDEGGRIEHITPSGVVIEHNGYRFELLPD